jgi:hypothetical protein
LHRFFGPEATPTRCPRVSIFATNDTFAGMPLPEPSRREIIQEDLQIARVALTTIVGDVRDFSEPAANAIHEAVAKLDQAEANFAEENRTAAQQPKAGAESPGP